MTNSGLRDRIQDFDIYVVLGEFVDMMRIRGVWRQTYDEGGNPVRRGLRRDATPEVKLSRLYATKWRISSSIKSLEINSNKKSSFVSQLHN